MGMRALALACGLFHAAALDLSKRGTAPAQSRRAALLSPAAAAAAMLLPAIAQAEASRDEGYAVRKTSAEWSSSLSPKQFFVLRKGGTESPNSSILAKEKRQGTFKCAGCGAPLFESAAKFESGTGWPSFASSTADVAVESSLFEALAGAEVRCGRCGGHLGDRFLDGLLFPGTAAFTTGKRYCIDGAALVFQPAAGGPGTSGDEQAPPQQLPQWLSPPGIKAV
ncbi:Mss4-like protein [Pelagophyceae sp. CCMP2097]|nr:Mss4-like protein [Pelagophyceae sp. CCMP2097]